MPYIILFTMPEQFENYRFDFLENKINFVVLFNYIKEQKIFFRKRNELPKPSRFNKSFDTNFCKWEIVSLVEVSDNTPALNLV